MEIETKKENGTTIVAIRGRMDAVTTPQIENRLGQLIEGGEKKLLVDLQQLDYISSAGLRALLSTAKRLKGEQGDLVFACLEGHVKEVFEMSGFYSIFKVFDSVETALEQSR
jgi:anti-anti-sigma factor